MADKKFDGLGLSEVLALGEEDLLDVLVGCGISCRTCYKNKGQKGWDDGGIICDTDNSFVSAPELSVCLKWREGLSEEQRRKCTQTGNYSPLDQTY